MDSPPPGRNLPNRTFGRNHRKGHKMGRSEGTGRTNPNPTNSEEPTETGKITLPGTIKTSRTNSPTKGRTRLIGTIYLNPPKKDESTQGGRNSDRGGQIRTYNSNRDDSGRLDKTNPIWTSLSNRYFSFQIDLNPTLLTKMGIRDNEGNLTETLTDSDEGGWILIYRDETGHFHHIGRFGDSDTPWIIPTFLEKNDLLPTTPEPDETPESD